MITMWPPDEDDLRIENTIMSLVKQNNNELDIALMHEINNIGKEYYPEVYGLKAHGFNRGMKIRLINRHRIIF